MHPKDAEGIANSVDPDQTAPLGAVWSGSALFAKTCLSKNLGNYGNQFRICSYHFYKYHWPNSISNATVRLISVKTAFFKLFWHKFLIPIQNVMVMHILICFIIQTHINMFWDGFENTGNIWVSYISRCATLAYASVQLLQMIYEGGSSVNSTLASGARGPGFNPRDRRGKLLVPEHAFPIVICSDDIKNSVPSFGSGH